MARMTTPEVPSRLRSLFRSKFVRDTLALQIGKIGVTASTLLAAFLVARLLGVQAYGVWALAQSLFSIAQVFDLTGIVVSTSTTLPMAVGAKDQKRVLDLLAVYVKIMAVWALILLVGLMIAAPRIAAASYGDSRAGVLAATLALAVLPDALYNLVITTLQSQRAMTLLAGFQNVNQFTLLVCTAGALVISPTPEGMVGARLVYSVTTMAMALWLYQRQRRRYEVPYPAMGEIAQRALRISPRPFLGFGLLNALDKKVANLYTEIPLQLVGIYAGTAAAGYLELGFKALSIPALLGSALFDNLQAVVPQAVGRGDFARLRRDMLRIVIGLAAAAVLFYSVFALLVPVFVPLLFGAAWTLAVPVVVTLAVYGAVTLVGGVFGPLYRALNLLRPILAIKVGALLVILPGLWLLTQIGAVESAWQVNGLLAPTIPVLEQNGAVVGAWIVNGLMMVSVGLTVAVSLTALSSRD
ncbi:MAG: lipopolysaccharide biosynthesis protein [Anaerolineae bacterium]|nr:lipopolysaccharide biosynthesis protein [Anaerolineae bacterium]